jgi:hypothetical protein
MTGWLASQYLPKKGEAPRGASKKRGGSPGRQAAVPGTLGFWLSGGFGLEAGPACVVGLFLRGEGHASGGTRPIYLDRAPQG